jgi:virginiamycin B lyase
MRRLWLPAAQGIPALILATLLALTFAPRADAFVYWVDSGQRDAIGRAKLDGTRIDKRFIEGYAPGSVAVDARYIYWAGLDLSPQDSESSTIGRARLNGTKVDRRFIPLYPEGFSESIREIAVDDEYIYWAENLIQKPPGSNFAKSIGRATLDGSDVDHNFITELGSFPRGLVTDVAVDANHIYWSQSPGFGSGSGGAIGRANLDGTGIDPEFIPFPPGSEPVAVAVDAAHIYWFNADNIARANPDGTEVDPSFISRLRESRPMDLAVGAEHIYWAGGSGRIGRADLDGSGVDRRFITGAGRVSGIAVDRRGATHRDLP